MKSETRLSEGGSPCQERPAAAAPAPSRVVGIDVGTETIKIVELRDQSGVLQWTRRGLAEHHKNPGPVLIQLLEDWDWPSVQAVAVSGRLGRLVNLPRIPTKQAQARGARFLSSKEPATIVSIGSHGFSVLELRASGNEVFRENSRCSQGTGNFLRQLVQRFSLSIEEASDLCADVEKAAPLSGRCPVILKTDMTHLANQGESRAQILAGLFDAVCHNVLALLKPGGPENVLLIGGVSRSRRIRETFQRALVDRGMHYVPLAGDDAVFVEALGGALLAAEGVHTVPPLSEVLAPAQATRFVQLPSMAEALGLVRRMPPLRPYQNGKPVDLVLGFDIGSTGSKLVALDPSTREVVWEGYGRTAGNPVGAAQALLKDYLEQTPDHYYVHAAGVTGSGREMVGSLMTTCYGPAAVFILNEIAAHAAGALQYDPRVDTIFEIGGQDAKYIRLAGGRVVDCAMNEACSAGTGSFIEEQGSRFQGIDGVAQLSQVALCAKGGVSLGQHCSVFMAEIIDDAVAAGFETPSVIAGLYDSVVQNYLHRVKGNRSVGQVIFCQGMPFASDALAAAVARQTGSQVIVPPNPGTVGALGIALLAGRELAWKTNAPLDLGRLLEARLDSKETFVCKSTRGCGGPGNQCRIHLLRTVVENERQRFTWGGACSLHDKAARRKKLPDRSPDPFREREELVQELRRGWQARPGSRSIGITDEFTLKGLFPFFATFLYQLGWDLRVSPPGDGAALKRGIQGAHVPFCAPLQLYHGLINQMADESCERLFLPMIRSLPRAAYERDGVTCPILQASPHIAAWDLQAKLDGRVLAPVVDIGEGNLESAEFIESCGRLAASLGVTDDTWRPGYKKAVAAQAAFDQQCWKIGERSLAFSREHGLPVVVVLGRPYTIYSTVLNSNVPAILREQGVMAVPLDCYPVAREAPVFHGVYWSSAQRILRAAQQIRLSPDVYSLYCSNYSCGPDSFNLAFYSHIMEGKPFAVIETDGHSGDAGTKTRVEAFLYCVAEDRHHRTRIDSPNLVTDLQVDGIGLPEIRPEEQVLIGRLGVGSDVVAACLRGLGLKTEVLPPLDPESLRLGRRYTSGKECVPLTMTLGTLLQRLERDKDTDQRFAVLMPGTRGPCRFGVYGLLNGITLQRLGWSDRVRFWSPTDANYFAGTSPGLSTLLYSGVLAADVLLDALLEVRPVERTSGEAQRVYKRAWAALLQLLETASRQPISLPAALWQAANGRLFGIKPLLARAAGEFAAARTDRAIPTVLLVGEIYVRLNAFANDGIIEALEQRGCRVRLAPLHEWLDYCDDYARKKEPAAGIARRVSALVQRQVHQHTAGVMASHLHGLRHPTVQQTLDAASPYMPEQLGGEAVLTLGCAIQEWREGHIHAVLNVGPHECMPTKIAESQFAHVSEKEGLLSLTLPLSGDGGNASVIDQFAFEVHRRFERRCSDRRAAKR